MDSIFITIPKKEKKLVGVVRIQPEAEELVRQFCIETDLSASEVVSRIILDAGPFVKFIKEE